MLARLQTDDIAKWAEDYLSALADGRQSRRLLDSLRVFFGTQQGREPMATL